MELRKHLSPKSVFVGLYVLFFVIYIVVGLQPAEATQSYEISTTLNIPSINLNTDVANLKLESHKLETPSDIVGRFQRAENKTLLIGHSTSVFQNLDRLQIGEEVVYDGTIYYIYSKNIVEKAAIDMNKLLAAAEKDTLVIMTCAGTELDNGDATHRLIITAST
ncbi:sortase [Candidatus Saccharibacteria bacterium]|nr:sortase [Candidatus Saccharibacteria bacterium]